MVTYYSQDGSPCHPDDDGCRHFVLVDDYEDALWELEQLRKAVVTTAEETAKLLNERTSCFSHAFAPTEGKENG